MTRPEVMESTDYDETDIMVILFSIVSELTILPGLELGAKTTLNKHPYSLSPFSCRMNHVTETERRFNACFAWGRATCY